MARRHIVLDLTDMIRLTVIEVQTRSIPKRYREVNSIYPFALMKPGQSFFIPNENYLRACRTLCQAVATYRKRTNDNKVFVVRSRNKKQPNHINPNHEVGARGWRTECRKPLLAVGIAYTIEARFQGSTV
jgi:hypothetical protein